MDRDDLTREDELDPDEARADYIEEVGDEVDVEGRFSTGMEDLPPTREKEAERRFSEGQELEDRIRQGDEQVVDDELEDDDDDDDDVLT